MAPLSLSCLPVKKRAFPYILLCLFGVSLIPLLIYFQSSLTTKWIQPFAKEIYRLQSNSTIRNIATRQVARYGADKRDFNKQVSDMTSQVGDTQINSKIIHQTDEKASATIDEQQKIELLKSIQVSDTSTKAPAKPETHSKFIVRTPGERIKCIEAVLAPYIKEIEQSRIALIKKDDPWTDFETNNASRFVTFSENKTFFQDIWKYNNVKTVYFEESYAKMKPCLIGDGNLHYDFGINNCSGVLSRAKRHVMFGDNVYDMRCTRNPPEVMDTFPIRDAALQVGLPEKFSHHPVYKTWTYMHVIRNAVVTVYGDVTTENLDIIAQRCFQNIRVDVPEDPSTLPIYDEVFSLSLYYGKGIFHANIEDISRLVPYLTFLQRNPDIKIHIYDLENPPLFLSLLGIDSNRLINGTVRAKILHQPAQVNCCLPPFFSVQLESLYMRSHLPNSQRDLIIIVKRSRRRNRFFRNHKLILKMLEKEAEKHDLRVIEFRDDPVPPLNVTANMFNRAIMVVAPHGAGESNLIFTQPGTLLLEGLCIDRSDGLVNVVFRTLSHILGGYYYGYFKGDAHCTETTPEELQPYVRYFLNVLIRQND